MTPEHIIWNNQLDRLLMSGRPDAHGRTAFEDYVYLGNRQADGLPLIVPSKRDNPHVWIMGGTGVGKTARVLAPFIAQRIAGGQSVIVLDPKSDRAFFESCAVECHHQRIPFRWVDITPGRYSYAFSPFAQSHAEAQTLVARAEIVIQALNLDHGSVYGGSYYTAMDELFVNAVFTLFPEAKSASEIARRLDSPGEMKRCLGAKGWDDTNHVRAIFSKLAGATPLNITPRSRGVTPAVLENAIDLRHPFYVPQVIYFSLDAKEMRTTTRATIGLAFYNLLAAAKYVGPKPAVKVVCVIDERRRSWARTSRSFSSRPGPCPSSSSSRTRT